MWGRGRGRGRGDVVRLTDPLYSTPKTTSRHIFVTSIRRLFDRFSSLPPTGLSGLIDGRRLRQTTSNRFRWRCTVARHLVRHSGTRKVSYGKPKLALPPLSKPLPVDSPHEPRESCCILRKESIEALLCPPRYLFIVAYGLFDFDVPSVTRFGIEEGENLALE